MRLSILWRIMEIDEGVIRRGRSQRRITRGDLLACENIRISSLFAAGDVPQREMSLVAKSEEKRMFSQARRSPLIFIWYERRIQ